MVVRAWPYPPSPATLRLAELQDGFPDRGRDELDVGIGIELVPGQHHDAFEPAHRPGIFRGFVHDLSVPVAHATRVRTAARPVRLSLNEYLAQEGWFLNISRHAENTCALECRPKCVGAANHHFRVNDERILPVYVRSSLHRCRESETRNIGQEYGQALRRAPSAHYDLFELSELCACYGTLEIGHAVVESQEVMIRVGVAVAPGLVAEKHHPPCVARIRRDDHATFASRH